MKKIIILIFVSCAVASSGYLFYLNNFFGKNSSKPSPTEISAVGTIEVAFSPNHGITPTVVKAINQAKQNILVEAYSFSSREIAQALVNAKKRGIDVEMILDKSQITQKYSASKFFVLNGIGVKIDIDHAIFHNKVMIIDNLNVITGSFNFTHAAETKNAENLLILRNNPQLAQLYTQDWYYNWRHAVLFQDFNALNSQGAKP